MTRLRQRTLEELQRRNYSPETTRSYIHAVKQFAEYFGKSPQKLDAEEIRRYQLYLLNEKKYTAGSVKVHISAQRSASSASCILGDRPCNLIRTFIVWCPAEACRPITNTGSPQPSTSSCPSWSSVGSSAENSWLGCGVLSAPSSWRSTGSACRWPKKKPSAHF